MKPPKAGRPRKRVPTAKSTVTKRVRLLVDTVHDGNVKEAAKVTKVAYATLRDLYAGSNTNPELNTLEKLCAPYGLLVNWFTDPTYNDEVPASGWVFQVDVSERGRKASLIRRVLVPFAAWPLPEIHRLLQIRLAKLPPVASRPIVGDADEREFTVRLGTFLLAPLVEAEIAGTAGPLFDVFVGGRKPPGQDETIRQMKLLGRFWEAALAHLLFDR